MIEPRIWRLTTWTNKKAMRKFSRERTWSDRSVCKVQFKAARMSGRQYHACPKRRKGLEGKKFCLNNGWWKVLSPCYKRRNGSFRVKIFKNWESLQESAMSQSWYSMQIFLTRINYAWVGFFLITNLKAISINPLVLAKLPIINYSRISGTEHADA